MVTVPPPPPFITIAVLRITEQPRPARPAVPLAMSIDDLLNSNLSPKIAEVHRADDDQSTLKDITDRASTLADYSYTS